MLVLATVALAAEVPSIDDPLRTGASAAQDAAVVVGMEDYAFVADVPFAKRDAQAFHDWLLYTRGVPRERIRLLQGASAESIVRNVRQAAEEVGDDGTLWFYFAGHGAASASDGGRLLLADDVRQDPAEFETRAVRAEDIEDIGNDTGVNTIVVLDTCYAGLGRGGDELVAGKRFLVPTYATQQTQTVHVWTAASGDELSGPFNAAEHGAFTYFAIGALRGWADGELGGKRDGAVSLDEAQAYVSRALRSMGERSQTPTLQGASDEAVVKSRKLETPPSLDDLVAAAQAGPPVKVSVTKQEPMGTDLAALQARQAARKAAIAEARTTMRARAAEDWARTQQVAAGGGPEAEVALAAFIQTYEFAAVQVDGVTASVTIREVAKAKALLAKGGTGTLSFATINGGTRKIGSPPNEPGRTSNENERQVTVSTFLISTTEVSQALYESIMGTNPAKCDEGGCAPELPVQNVSFYDAARFCNALSAKEGLAPAYTVKGKKVIWNRGAKGYRLPTDAEWEFAARAGESTVFVGTDEPGAACAHGNVANGGTDGSWVKNATFPCDDGHAGLAPLASFRANAFGLYDMLGNVTEWVYDAHTDQPAGGTDPVTTKGKTRSWRGGSYRSFPRMSRTAFRHGIDPASASFERGFRVARDL